MIKKLLPKRLKLRLNNSKRWFLDLIFGRTFHFAKTIKKPLEINYKLEKLQDIKMSSSFDAKIFNLKKAAKLVAHYQIHSNEIFSFWKTIGNPSEKRGFKSGRTIVKGELSESIGGGLCQLAGLIYYASLEAGLEVMERYNHSMDLYTKETRYTPLGSDASVVYGYKDLRIKNPYSFPICFGFNVINNTISISLLSSQKITKKVITFREDTENSIDDKKHVFTFSNEKLIATSIYKKMQST